MKEDQFNEQITLFEKRYIPAGLDPDLLKEYKRRYAHLEYFFFCGMIQYLLDNFVPRSYKRYPDFVDFNAARAIMNEKITPEPVKEEPKGKYVPYSLVGTFNKLMKEIHLWYDQGIFWDFNGTLKPLTYPRTYLNKYIIFQRIAEESEKYFNNHEKLENFFKDSTEKLKSLRLKRRKEGHFKERKGLSMGTYRKEDN